MYSPNIIINILDKGLKDITITGEDENLIKVIKIIKVIDKKRPNRIDVIAHAHPKNMEIRTQHFTYKNATREQIKANLEWLGTY